MAAKNDAVIMCTNLQVLHIAILIAKNISFIDPKQCANCLRTHWGAAQTGTHEHNKISQIVKLGDHCHTCSSLDLGNNISIIGVQNQWGFQGLHKGWTENKHTVNNFFSNISSYWNTFAKNISA